MARSAMPKVGLLLLSVLPAAIAACSASTPSKTEVSDAGSTDGNARSGPDLDASPLDGAPADAALPVGTMHVYVGSGSALRVHALDMTTGALSPLGDGPPGVVTAYGAFNSNRTRFYSFAGGTPNKVVALARDPATGSLTVLNEQSLVPNGPTHLTVHPSDDWVLTAHFAAGSVSVLGLDAQGQVGALADTRQPAAEAHQVMVDPSGKYVFVPCRSGNVVAQYTMNSATGKLTPNSPASVPAAIAGAGPRHMAFHPGGAFAYVLNEQNGTLTSFQFSSAAGTLTPIESVSAVPAGFTETASAHVVVHPSGKFLYASNRTHNSIAIFTIDGISGRTTLVSNETAGGTIKTPRDFEIDPTGRYLVVANQGTSTVLVLAIQPDGRLIQIGSPLASSPGAQYVGIVPALSP